MPTGTLLSAKRLASLAEAAEYLGVTERTIRNYIARGDLTGYRLGKRSIRIDVGELESLLTVIPAAGGAR
ncbi:helix-turn-helix transcriptional regulator [Brachybacterium huguangmaarense]